MAQFMLILKDQPTDFEGMSPDDMGAIVGEYIAWRQKQEAAGRLIGGEKLADESGKWLTATDSGVQVTDGPYSEAKEVLGGYFMITADSYDHAVEISSDCPHLKYGLRIEIQRIEQH